MALRPTCCLFFFNGTATTEIYTLSLHDALPISDGKRCAQGRAPGRSETATQGTGHPFPGKPVGTHASPRRTGAAWRALRSEEHTSELQSHVNLVCRLLLEKKKK